MPMRTSMFHCSRRQFAVRGAGTMAWAAIAGARASAAQFEFKCGSDFAQDHPSSVRLKQMWTQIERESGGRIRTQLFVDSALGSEAAMLTQVRLGALQFGVLSPSTLAEVVPSANTYYVGFAFKDSYEGFRVSDGPLGAYICQDAATKGLHVLRTFWNSGMLAISSTTRPIRTPDDMHGFKIRCVAGGITVDLFKTLGASPVVMGFNEIYTALQTKIVDGTTAPLVTIESSRIYEVVKYISLTNHAWSGAWLVGSGEAWKSLPPELQDLLERNATKYAWLERRDTLLVATSLADKLARQGVTINPVDQAPFRAQLRPYFEKWSNAFGPTVGGLLESSLGRKLA